MGWLFLLLVVAAVVLVLWDVFVRDKRGFALAWNVAAGAMALAAGVAQGLEVDGPWALIALVLFFVLFGLGQRAEAVAASQRHP